MASRTRERHVALLIEDDPAILAILIEFVTSLGHDYVHAGTLEEARARIDAGGFCYVLLDMQVPPAAGTKASVGCGETILGWLRTEFPARTSKGKHLLPVLVTTNYSREPSFVSRLYDEREIDGFLPKPFDAQREVDLDKIRAALRRAEREDHAVCLASKDLPAAVLAPLLAAPNAVRLAIYGAHRGGRTDVLVSDVRGSLQDLHFAVFLAMIDSRLKAPGSYPSAAKLGMTRNLHAPTRIRNGLKALLPPGFALVETEKMVGCRLNPLVTIESVAWNALKEHPVPAVRKIATEWAGRA